MIFVGYEKETETRAKVNYQNFEPSKMKPEALQRGVTLSTIPEPEYREGYNPELYINPITGEIWYEYVPVVHKMTTEEEIADLKARLERAEQDNLVALEALTELYEMLIGMGA